MQTSSKPMTESPVSAEYYFSIIRDEVRRRIKEGYSGSIDFKFNFMHGDIANMNEASNKSHKFKI